MTGPTETQIAAAVTAVVEAWRRRSPRERAGFRRRLATGPVSGPPEQIMRTVRRRGALSGSVLPVDLVQDIDAGQRDWALDVLGSEFDRLYDGVNWRWTLRSDTRRNVLDGFDPDDLPAALRDVDRIPTDAAGDHLRVLCSGGTIPFGEPRVAVQALSWAAPLGGRLGDLAEARRRARIDDLRSTYADLVEHGVVGRRAALDAMRRFALVPVLSSGPLPMLSIVGLGGSGKSTLIGALVRPLLGDLIERPDHGPAVVVIDFDRVQFRLDAELDLSFEVTRQLGMAHPEAGSDFSALRCQAREERLSTGTDLYEGTHTPEQSRSQAQRFEHDAAVIVRLHGLHERPVLLVVDTFEEWQRDRPVIGSPRGPGNDPDELLRMWLDRLRDRMGLRGLRVVISGRATLRDARLPIRLHDLSEVESRMLLERHGVPAAQQQRLARLVGGNPLTLRVAARLFLSLGETEREDYLSGGHEPARMMREEMRRAVLYDRFLSHIAHTQVRELAHPALLLRLVTPALVRHVIGPVCGLDLDDARAWELVSLLEDEVWLFRRTADGLRHQPDVRRAMLDLMRDEPERRELAGRVHRTAIAWYRSGEAGLDPEAAAVEALYHELMLEPQTLPIDQWFSDDERIRQVERLGESVADFTPPVAVQIRVLRGEEITTEEADHLAPGGRLRWIVQHGRRLVGAGRAANAVELYEREIRGLTEPPWLAQAYAESCLWGRYAAEAARYQPPARKREWPGRYSVLNRVVTGIGCDHELTWVDYYLAALEVRAGERGEVIEQLFYSLLLSYQLNGPWRHSGIARQVMSRRGRDSRAATDRFPVDQLRRLITWAAAGAPGPPMHLRMPATVYRPDPDWVAEIRDLLRVPAVSTDSWHNLRTDQFFGDQARRFGQEIGPEIPLRPEMIRRRHVLALLRGDNPELRPAIEVALRRRAGGRGLTRLAALAESVMPVFAVNLRPDATPGGDAPRAAVDQFLTTLVQFVDRSGHTGPFLAAVLREWPTDDLIRDVHHAFLRWDAAHDRLFDAIAVRES
jgi:hypothetical protein